MAFEHPGLRIPMPAGEVITVANQFKFVKLNTSGQVIFCTATTDKPFGIVQTTAAAVNDPVTVMLYGVSKVQANAALTLADKVGTSSDAQAAAYVPGTDTTKFIVGEVILATTAADALASIAFNCLGVGRGA